MAIITEGVNGPVVGRLGNARTLLLAYNTTESLVYYGTCEASAYAGTGELSTRFLGHQTGDSCHAYIAFMDVETGEVSDSVYAGILVLESYSA